MTLNWTDLFWIAPIAGFVGLVIYIFIIRSGRPTGVISQPNPNPRPKPPTNGDDDERPFPEA